MRREQCPRCGNAAFSWGPLGQPQRRCHWCRHTWIPGAEKVDVDIEDDAFVRALLEDEAVDEQLEQHLEEV